MTEITLVERLLQNPWPGTAEAASELTRLTAALAEAERRYRDLFELNAVNEFGCENALQAYERAAKLVAVQADVMNTANARIAELEKALAEAEWRAEKAAALNAYFIDCCEYHDSYGVEGSGFVACNFCNAGGAPGVKVVHGPDCPVTRGGDMAEEWFEEKHEAENALTAASARIAELEGAVRDCRTSYNGYAITKNEQYPDVLANFWRELQRIDKRARSVLKEARDG